MSLINWKEIDERFSLAFFGPPPLVEEEEVEQKTVPPSELAKMLATGWTLIDGDFRTADGNYIIEKPLSEVEPDGRRD